MNKSELVKAIAKELETTEKSANKFVDAFVKVTTDAVADGEKVTLVGFGTFEPAEYKGREGYNPKTKEKIEIPGGVKPKFTPGKDFRDKVSSATKEKSLVDG